MHLFWLVLLVPAVILGQWIWPILKQRSIWSVCFLVVGAVIVAWLAMGLPTLGTNQPSLREILTMFAFRLVTLTDLPLVQLLIACCVGWFFSKRVQVSKRVLEADPTIDQPVTGTSA